MNSRENWELEIDPDFFKELRRVPQDYTDRILEVVEALSVHPFIGDVRKMKGEKNIWRRRIGAYRIFYEVFTEEMVIRVFHVERRTSKTY
jgi:mRNA interferase RelE/StbE